MLPPTVISEVARLLAQPGWSQRRVAAATGVSRATVGAIASGRRCILVEKPDDEEDLQPLGPIERCPTCGGRVYMPCRLCRVRALKSAERRAAQAHREAQQRRRTASHWPPQPAPRRLLPGE